MADRAIDLGCIALQTTAPMSFCEHVTARKTYSVVAENIDAHSFN